MNPAPEEDPSLEARIAELVDRATRAYLAEAGQPEAAVSIELQVPRNPDHGDWSASAGMKLAKILRRKPLEIAEAIAAKIEPNELIESPTVAAPGYINVRVARTALAGALCAALTQGSTYGASRALAGRKMMVEFVSANPTGPLHVGHGRNAVVGDTLARIYAAAGAEVTREYYFNDAGVQMKLLGDSLRARYLEQCGMAAELPENGYKGAYMIDLAKKLFAREGTAWVDEPAPGAFTRFAADEIMAMIRADMDALGIGFDVYFSESSLHEAGKVNAALERLRERGALYEQEGALWLRSTAFGDEKDRVVRKSDGTFTYLAPDIAYHEDKFARGFDRVVNIWGADHHGYVIRLKAALAALGYAPDRLHCVLIQMVGVADQGVAKKLSTRAGDFEPLATILSEIGAGVVRFFYLQRAADSQLTFDLDLARKQSMDNPYYYVQYAHARCCSLMRKAEEELPGWTGGASAPLDMLAAPEERAIILQISRLPGVIADAARKDEPLPVANYLRELATAFHAYFSAGNKDAALRCLLPENRPLTEARLTLILALKQTLASGLAVLGIAPIERL